MPTSFRSILFLFFLLGSLTSVAQEKVFIKEHTITFKPQFFQIKDAFNYGLAHSGLNLNAGYTFTRTGANLMFTFSPDLSFGVNYNQGVGLAWHLRPVDLYWGFRLPVNTFITDLYVGPYAAANYQVQLYPELQSGHMFWFTTLEYGPRIKMNLPVLNHEFRITVTNSLAGWTSRPKPSTETYFYSLRFSDFVDNPHQNLNFGSYDIFNHSQLSIETIRREGKRLTLGYEFDYIGLFYNPEVHYLAHSISLTWKIGKI